VGDQRADALVTDAHERSAVAALRGLGRAALRPAALGPERFAPGLWSRYVVERHMAADAVADPKVFADAVGDLARNRGPFVVYPCQEESIDALLDVRDLLPREVVLPYPEGAAVRTVRDKRLLPELAAQAGLSTPARVAEGSAAEAAGVTGDGAYVVKPMFKSTALERAHVVNGAARLNALLAGLPPDELVVVERRSLGPLASVSLVIDRDGGVVARFQQEARRTWPTDAGGSTLAVSVVPDEALALRLGGMLAEVGFWGLAQVQFIATSDGPELIDLNPRFYGSMALALAAGVNLPAIWHAVATGAPLPTPAAYRVGVTYRWLEGELFAALHGRPGLALRRAPAPRVGPMWASDDPLPAAMLAVRSVLGWVTRQASRLADRATRRR